MTKAKRETTNSSESDGPPEVELSASGQEFLDCLNDVVVALDELREAVEKQTAVLEQVGKKLGLGAKVGAVVDSIRGR